MGIWSKIFSTRNVRSTTNSPLVSKLVSNDEPTFLSGLGEAVRLADSGNYSGVEAMRDAIRLRSGKSEVTFYEPGVIISRGFDRYAEARNQIIALATRNALLDDVYVSGNLICAFNFLSNRDEFDSLLDDIYRLGGASAGYVFQLLFNELIFSAKFKAGLYDST